MVVNVNQAHFAGVGMAVLSFDPTGQIEFGVLVEPNGARVPLCGRSLVIGSSAGDCDIVITDDPSVGAQHCRISKAGGRILLEALPAGRVTSVNGETIITREIADQDVIQLGNLRLRFEAADLTPTGFQKPDDAWFVELGGGYHGPFSLAEMKERIDAHALSINDYVRHGAKGTPQPAGRMSALKALFNQVSPGREGWFIEAGQSATGPLTMEEVAERIRSSQLSEGEFVKYGVRGTPQPAGRIPQLKSIFAELKITAPPTAGGPAVKSTSAQSPDLQAMVDALAPGEVADSPPNKKREAQPTDQRPRKPRPSRQNRGQSRRRRKPDSSDSALDALIEDVLFSDDPVAPSVPTTSAGDAVAEPSSSPTSTTEQSAPRPEPAPTSVATPTRIPAPRPAPKPASKKKAAKSSSGSSAWSENPNLKKAVFAVAGLAVVYAAFAFWPSSQESSRPQYEKLQALSDELHGLIAKEASLEEWSAFSQKAFREGEKVEGELAARVLDPAGEELRDGLRILNGAVSDAKNGKTVKADLFKKFVERAKQLL